MTTFEAFADNTRDIANADQLKSALSSALLAEGFGNHILTSLSRRSVGNVAWFEFPKGYAETYLAEKWQAVDPILKLSMVARRPFQWNDVARQNHLSRSAKKCMQSCEDFGVHSGIVFPLFGPEQRCDVLSISQRERHEIDPKRIDILQAICTHAWWTYTRLTSNAESFTDDGQLTERECEVLLWLKDGKSNDQISEIMRLSDKTVQFHISNAMNKLGASNRISAVVIALQRRLIRL